MKTNITICSTMHLKHISPFLKHFRLFFGYGSAAEIPSQRWSFPLFRTCRSHALNVWLWRSWSFPFTLKITESVSAVNLILGSLWCQFAAIFNECRSLRNPCSLLLAQQIDMLHFITSWQSLFLSILHPLEHNIILTNIILEKPNKELLRSFWNWSLIYMIDELQPSNVLLLRFKVHLRFNERLVLLDKECFWSLTTLADNVPYVLTVLVIDSNA